MKEFMKHVPIAVQVLGFVAALVGLYILVGLAVTLLIGGLLLVVFATLVEWARVESAKRSQNEGE